MSFHFVSLRDIAAVERNELERPGQPVLGKVSKRLSKLQAA